MSSAQDSEEVRRGTDGSGELHQVRVLKKMSEGYATGSLPKQYEINELAALTNMHDERETQRVLYILEGHKYVTPCPAGDLTSKIWQITADGFNAVRTLRRG